MTDISAHYDDINNIVIVEGQHEGKLTTQVVMAASRVALKLACEHYCDLLLFDITMMKESQTIVQGYLAMKEMEKTTGITLNFKCAVVYDPCKYSPLRAEYIEAVVAHQRNPPFKMFSNRELAIDWLKAE